MYIPEHRTPASSKCLQLCTPQPLFVQFPRQPSEPPHPTLSSQMVPLPCPKAAKLRAAVAGPNPSCAQTTLASERPQKSSQTVPH